MNAPSGQVTLVFTDLQGSTELWERLGDAFRPVLEAHHRIVRERIAARAGYEVKTEGDAFMVAFPRASDALRFAADVQEGLHAHPWPASTGELLVRIGAHAGEPLCITDSATGRADYYGPAVNRAARIAAAAHGGQVLFSAAAWELASEAREGIEAKDLGEHRLKGLERPERIWQAMPRSLASRTFPPLKTLSARPTNLPSPTTSFVGRERELRELAAVFADPATRLVTLTGPGGTGKTRLALRLGADLLDRFEGGIWFADLSEARDATAVADAAARALGVPVGEREIPEERVAAALEYRKPLLLVLDNFEQVVDAAEATLGRWRRKAPEARFLVTSRALLGLAGEREFEVPPLLAPATSGAGRSTAKIEAYDGVRLFLERAREADPNFVPSTGMFPEIAELVARLDGIPLAIELAASRLKVLRPADMLARLDQRFQVLRSTRRDLPPRQQTLLGAIDWTYDLLSPWEKAAFAQLSVFHGGGTLVDAEAVLDLAAFPDAPDALTAVQTLREKSVLRSWSTAAGARFGMYASLQEYGARKLEGKDREAAVRRHAARIAASSGEIFRRLENDPSVEAVDAMELERENMRAALRWSLDAKEGALARILATSLSALALSRGGETAVMSWLEAALALPAAGDLAQALEATTNLAYCCGRVGDTERARELATKVEREARAAGLAAKAAYGTIQRHRFDGGPPGLDEALGELRGAGQALLAAGDRLGAIGAWIAAARRVQAVDAPRSLGFLDEAENVARGCSTPIAFISVHLGRASTYDLLGRLEDGLRELAAVEPLLRQVGDRSALSECLQARSRLLSFTGAQDESRAAGDEAEEILRDLGAKPRLGHCLVQFATRHISHHEFASADRRLEEACRIAREVGHDSLLTLVLNAQGLLLTRTADYPGAEARLKEGEAVARRTGNRRNLAQNRNFFADLMSFQKRWSEALPAIEEALAVNSALGVLRSVAPNRVSRGYLLLELGRAGEAVAGLREALRDLEATEQSATELGLRARLFLGRALAVAGDPAAARVLLPGCRAEVAAAAKDSPAAGDLLRPHLERFEAAAGGSA